MNTKRILFLLLAAGALLFAACTEKIKPVTIDSSLWVGKWCATDITTEYWRFDADGNGETWDVSDDVQEGEGTRFNWTTEMDQLQIDLYGEMGQHVYYDWTVTQQSQDSLTFKDIYSNYRTFVRQ